MRKTKETKKTKGVYRVFEWLLGKKNSYGNNIYQQFGNWVSNRHPDGTPKSDPDLINVMDQDGNFTYKDNTSGVVRLWNDITGKTGQMKDIALNNWTQQYNQPEHQKELLKSSGYNPNLVANQGVSEFTPQPVQDTINPLEAGLDLASKAYSLSGLSADSFSKVLSNVGVMLDMPRKSVDNALWSARRDPDRIANMIRRDLQQENINDNNLENDYLESENRNISLRVDNLLNRMAEAITSDDVRNYFTEDPYGENGQLRLNEKGKERNRIKNDAENKRWLSDIAVYTRQKMEEDFYNENGKYPDWNVDVFNEQFNQEILGMVDKMDDGIGKTIVLGVISAIHALTGSVGGSHFKLGF